MAKKETKAKPDTPKNERSKPAVSKPRLPLSSCTAVRMSLPEIPMKYMMASAATAILILNIATASHATKWVNR